MTRERHPLVSRSLGRARPLPFIADEENRARLGHRTHAAREARWLKSLTRSPRRRQRDLGAEILRHRRRHLSSRRTAAGAI